MRPEWKDFVGGKWENEVNVRDFIQKNYHPYEGDEAFLAAQIGRASCRERVCLSV